MFRIPQIYGRVELEHSLPVLCSLLHSRQVDRTGSWRTECGLPPVLSGCWVRAEDVTCPVGRKTSQPSCGVEDRIEGAAEGAGPHSQLLKLVEKNYGRPMLAWEMMLSIGCL